MDFGGGSSHVIVSPTGWGGIGGPRSVSSPDGFPPSNDGMAGWIDAEEMDLISGATSTIADAGTERRWLLTDEANRRPSNSALHRFLRASLDPSESPDT